VNDSKAAFLKEAALSRGDLTDAEWRIFDLLLPKAIRQLELGFRAAFEMLVSLRPPADEEHAIDSTIVRAHQHAAGVKGGTKNKKRSAARAAASRPKSTSARMPKATR
jgi:hypothetical protein